MALTRIQTQNLQEGAVTTAILSNTATAAFATSADVANFASSLAPKVTTVNVANSAFAVLDDTAVNVGGGYIVITGTNFAEGVTVLVDTTAASAVSRINSTTLQVQVPPKSAATYNLFVVNPDGGTGIKVNGITYSGLPTWVTASPLSYGLNNVAFGFNLSATGANTYSVAAGSTLPANTTLLANGYFYGNVTVGVDTNFSFDIVAIDTELQDASKTFSLTVYLEALRQLWVSGTNTNGRLGLGDTINRSSPVQVAGTNWSKVSTGTHVLAIKTTGTLWTWGVNTDGQHGLNDVIDRSSPVQIGSGTDWNKVFRSADRSFVIKTNGTLWAWGKNQYGQLGLGNVITRSSPVQIGSSTWSEISGKGRTTHGIRTDGTLWGWGLSLYGIIGSNGGSGFTDSRKSSPIQVGTGTNWSKVSNRDSHVLAIKTDGTLWYWGDGGYGRLGNNQSFGFVVSSPVQLGSLTNWREIEAGDLGALAIKTDGTLWGWGYGDQGQLGRNNTGQFSSPMQIGSDTNWSKVAFDSYRAVALKTNGSIWGWGSNSDGSLGLGNTIDRSSPVQISSAQNWVEISAESNIMRLTG